MKAVEETLCERGERQLHRCRVRRGCVAHRRSVCICFRRCFLTRDDVVVVVGLVGVIQVCDVLGGYRVLIGWEVVTEIAEILLSGDIAGQRCGKVDDVGFTAGREAVLVELDVFGDDAFAKSRDPQ